MRQVSFKNNPLTPYSSQYRQKKQSVVSIGIKMLSIPPLFHGIYPLHQPLAPWTIQRLHLDSTLKDYSTKPTSAHRRSQLLYNIIFLNQVHFYHLQICQLHIIYYLFLNLLILYLSQILSTSRLIMPLQSRLDFGSSQGQPGTSGSNRNSTPSSSRPHRIRQSPSQHGNLISPSPDSRRRLSINTTPVPSKRVVEVLDGSSEDERVQPEKKKQKKKTAKKKKKPTEKQVSDSPSGYLGE